MDAKAFKGGKHVACIGFVRLFVRYFTFLGDGQI